jgi:hypothetical protein
MLEEVAPVAEFDHCPTGVHFIEGGAHGVFEHAAAFHEAQAQVVEFLLAFGERGHGEVGRFGATGRDPAAVGNGIAHGVGEVEGRADQ